MRNMSTPLTLSGFLNEQIQVLECFPSWILDEVILSNFGTRMYDPYHR